MIIRLKHKFFDEVVPLYYTLRDTRSWDDVHDYIKDSNPNLIINQPTYYRFGAYEVNISNDNDANLTWFMLKYSDYIK